MHDFKYKEEELFCDKVRIRDIVEEVGSPVYIYSYKTIMEHFNKLTNALKEVEHLICYSVKSNSNIAICRALIKEGAGVDIVSGGELYRAKQAGVDTAKVMYAGVGKTKEEIKYALENNILGFTVESKGELMAINQVASALNKKANVSLRVNPDVDSKTHVYITTGKKGNKFGLDIEAALAIYKDSALYESLNFSGVHMHIGSQITTQQPYIDAIDKMIPLIERIKNLGIDLKHFDLGGGLGIIYDNEEPMDAENFASIVIPRVKKLNMKIIIEPGRFIVGNAGILVTKVLYVKESLDKNFIIVDGGMNDLIRPSLYQAYHHVLTVKAGKGEDLVNSDVVGPICESGDFFAKDRGLPKLLQGDLLAIMSCGAYGFTMSSNYNSRPRVCEVLVNGDRFQIIRERETYESLVKGESIPEFLV